MDIHTILVDEPLNPAGSDLLRQLRGVAIQRTAAAIFNSRLT
jgi:hypothetical protein